MLGKISEILWGVPLISALLAVGIFLSFKLKFIQVRKLKDGLKALFSTEGKGSISTFSSTATSLAAMLGTGNIIGVAMSVYLGGVGALFWMTVASVFGMAISYAEGYFAIKTRKETENGEYTGGAFYYIAESLGKIPAKFYSICMLLTALLGMGTMTQSNSIAVAFCELYPFSGNTIFIAVILTVFSAFLLCGGLKRIAGASTVLVPVMGSVYLLGVLLTLAVFWKNIPYALCEILSSAFDFKAGIFGISASALRYGIARGVFSNEAGLGTCACAAAVSRVNSAHEEGLCTMVGTFLDTTVMCSLTGLAIVASRAHETGLSGVKLTSFALNSAAPQMGNLIVAVSLILFAFASIIGWSYYGESAAVYAFGEKSRKPYRALYIAAVACGVFLSIDAVWQLADITNALLAIPNLAAICFLSKKLKEKRGKKKKTRYI